MSGPDYLVSGPLPDYARPPVIEVAVGVEFFPVEELDTVQLVRLHDVWRDRYPLIQLQPEVASGPQLPIVFGGVLPVRLWSQSENQESLIQVQADRLIVNWRRFAENREYPRYGTLRAEFQARWS